MKEDIGLAGTDKALIIERNYRKDGEVEYYSLTFDEHPVEGGHVEEICQNPAGTVYLLRHCHLKVGHI